MKPFIVAEMSANHLGSLKRALKIVEAAAEAGADAIKIQTWSPDTMCIDRDYRLEHGPWAGRKLFDLYREAWTPWDWHRPIFDLAHELGLIQFSAAFDRDSVDFLETLGVDRHKVASFELTDLPLIRYIASKGKPMILSTGMASELEIHQASIECNGCDVTLLHCTSAYPADAADVNLSTITDLSYFGYKVGLSDHTMGIGVTCAAVSLGATMIEKHLTLSRADGGPDAGFSLEPHEFKQLVTECRRAAASIGEVKYGPGPSESTALRRSLWVCVDVKAGEELILGGNVVTARPALGLSPAYDLTGKHATSDIKGGSPLKLEMIL